MLKAVKQRWRNEQGLTLIELLAVIVILGIIAAIAVPSIGGLIDNSKKDAHIANAQQMANAAKLALTDANKNDPNAATITYTMDDLVNEGYLEEIKDPSADSYDGKKSKITVNTISTDVSKTNSTKISRQYTVTLKGTIGGTAITHINDKEVGKIKRDEVKLK